MFGKIRDANLFEWVLLPVGFIVGFLGFYFINIMYSNEMSLTWDMVHAIFLWLSLIFLMIIAATNEDVKEELRIVISEQVKEIQLLKQISAEELDEIKLLRKELTKKGGKRR